MRRVASPRKGAEVLVRLQQRRRVAASIGKASWILGWWLSTELEDGLRRCIESAKSAGKPQSL